MTVRLYDKEKCKEIGEILGFGLFSIPEDCFGQEYEVVDMDCVCYLIKRGYCVPFAFVMCVKE